MVESLSYNLIASDGKKTVMVDVIATAVTVQNTHNILDLIPNKRNVIREELDRIERIKRL